MLQISSKDPSKSPNMTMRTLGTSLRSTDGSGNGPEHLLAWFFSNFERWIGAHGSTMNAQWTMNAWVGRRAVDTKARDIYDTGI